MLRQHFEDNTSAREVVIVEETEPLGTGGAVKNGERYLDGTFLVFNGDVVASLDIQEILSFHREKKGIGTISMWEVEDPTSFGIIGFDSDSKITRFHEKPEPEEVFSNWINAGVYVLEPDVLDLIQPQKVTSIEREVFPQIALRNRLFGFKFYGYWLDAGTPEAYLTSHRVLMDERGPGPDSVTGAMVHQPVFLGNNCQVAEKAELGPYSVLGNNVEVASDVRIKGSVVLDNTIIGRECSITDSILGYGCRLGDNVVLGSHSVVGDGQVVKSGTVFEAESRIGML
jgi:mannose-1-phosphate guanylyltransferase